MRILNSIIILVVAFLIYFLTKTIIKKTFNNSYLKIDEKKQRTIIELFINLAKAFIIVVTLMMVLDVYGINVKSLLASLGVFAAVAALAMQDVLKDLIAGISIILEGQFRIGDTISIDDFKGEVIQLSLKTTRIKAYTGEIKIFANHNIQNVVNYSINNSLAIVDVSISYDTDLNKAEKVLSKLCERLSIELSDLQGEVQLVGVESLSDYAIIYRITCLTESMKHFDIQRKILKEVKMELDKNNIKIPFPQLVVHNE